MINFKYFFKSLISHNKINSKFIKLPYTYNIYKICNILFIENYIKNFIYYKSNITSHIYIIIELLFLNNYSRLFKIKGFNSRLKINYKSYKELKNLKKYTGLFIINTPKGIMSLSETLLYKQGGILLLYIL